MKYFLILLTTLFIFPFCTKDFKVIEATKQKWSGGTPDSGSGTKYVVSLLAKNTNKNLTIDQLWVGEDFYEVYAFKQLQNRRDTVFAKNDTILLKATKTIMPNRKGIMEEVKKDEPKPKPYEYKGEALIGYTLKGKRKYKEIETLKQLKFIPYP